MLKSLGMNGIGKSDVTRRSLHSRSPTAPAVGFPFFRALQSCRIGTTVTVLLYYVIDPVACVFVVPEYNCLFSERE